ncbi:PAS domain-containing protein [Planomonospora corallina]|uniref:PAS domain-containing protein n=1 Tax=Planomonospora corallina TaxID=1806052 RepID=A0ABV8IAS0_9ACTN
MIVCVHALTPRGSPYPLWGFVCFFWADLLAARKRGSAPTGLAGYSRVITRTLGWACGEYWQAGPKGTCLTRTASWARPDLDLSAFTGGDPMTVRRGQGLPGRVKATARPVWIRDHVHPDDRQTFTGMIAEFRAGRPAEAEYRITGLDGVTRWIWSRGTPRREDGRTMVDGISTDTTGRRERHRRPDAVSPASGRRICSRPHARSRSGAGAATGRGISERLRKVMDEVRIVLAYSAGAHRRWAFPTVMPSASARATTVPPGVDPVPVHRFP